MPLTARLICLTHPPPPHLHTCMRAHDNPDAPNYRVIQSGTCDSVGLSPISKDECKHLSKTGELLKGGEFKHENTGGRPFGCYAEVKNDKEGEWHFNSRGDTGQSCSSKPVCICKGDTGVVVVVVGVGRSKRTYLVYICAVDLDACVKILVSVSVSHICTNC